MQYTVKVRQGDRQEEITVLSGQKLLASLQRTGFFLPAYCGGKGSCGKCKVRVLSGLAKPPLPVETLSLSSTELAEGFRLACRLEVNADLVVEVPVGGEEAVLVTTDTKNIPIKPLVRREYCVVKRATIEEQLGEADRLEEALGLPGSIDYELMAALPAILREDDRLVTIVVAEDTVISVQGGKRASALYGIAFDLGTTTIAGYLLNLETGEEIGCYSALNPQRSFGADVISRAAYTMENHNGLMDLTTLIRREINKMVEYFGAQFGVGDEEIYHCTVVGNPTMLHILAGLPIEGMAISPFTPVISRRLDLKPSDLGIKMNSRGLITILPLISAYVGADAVAAILASGLGEGAEPALLLDIGTNGELALGHEGRILACATAAGPAFEGAQLRHGSGAVAGAIDRVRLATDGLRFTTIGGKPAQGICGSGVVELTAELLRTGIIDPTGKIGIKTSDKKPVPAALCRRIQEVDGQPAFLIASTAEGARTDLFFTQQDVRQVQMAKAAIAAGIEILLEEAGFDLNEVGTIYLAGGFGNYIDYHAAQHIGLLPQGFKGKILSLGNSAGVGAKMALLSRDCLAKADELAKRTEYIELSTNSRFQTAFLENISFQSLSAEEGKRL